jgi:hypothetical protein
LDDEHAKLLQTQQFPSESQFIWNNVWKIEIISSNEKFSFDRIQIDLEQNRYTQTIKEIREEIDIMQRHRHGLEEKLEMIVIKEHEELK